MARTRADKETVAANGEQSEAENVNGKLTAAQKKRLKKKQREAAKKSEK